MLIAQKMMMSFKSGFESRESRSLTQQVFVFD